MNDKCYGFITGTLITACILCYKIICLNKKHLADTNLIIILKQKLEDMNDLNLSCARLGNAIHNNIA